VPTVSAGSTRGTTYSSVWVGIDGYNNYTVEQIGTEQDVVNGKAVYQVWYEMYSSGDQQPEQVISSMTIQPGDSISASVKYVSSGAHAGDYELSITDNSRANDSFTTYISSSSVQSPAAQGSSAEWVVEAPSIGNSIAALANFGTVTFTNASATINGVTGPINDSAWQSQAINIGSNFGGLQDTTSVLVDSGSSFDVTYDATASGSGFSGSDRSPWAAAHKAAAASSNGAAGASATTPGLVLYGAMPTTPPARKPGFAFASGSTWS
jgi:Peptidase A4 family